MEVENLEKGRDNTRRQEKITIKKAEEKAELIRKQERNDEKMMRVANKIEGVKRHFNRSEKPAPKKREITFEEMSESQ